MKVVYNNESGVSIITPTEEVLKFATIDQIAQKDVPYDVKYWIVQDSVIPTDRTFRDAWELDLASLGVHSGVGGESNEFSKEVLDKLEGKND